jgi:hypothetical protein
MSSIPAAPTAPTRNTRRARLARLREEAEPLVAGERRAALRALLQQPLLTPDGAQPGMFALVRRHRDWLATWFAHHANWSLSITAEVARLRKIPATTTDSSRGAIDARSEESFTRTRYVLLCLALAALERSDRQITLGRLAEAVTNSLAADPGFAEAGFLWSLDNIAGRRDFVHALRLLLALGVLRRVQGDEEHFLHDRGSDALYNVARPVLAALLVCRRSPSLVSATELEVFDGIVNTMYDQQGKVELAKLSMLGELPRAVFARICRGPEEGVTGLYAGDALNEYAKVLGLDEVTTREVQSAFETLKASNLVMRNGDRGPVTVTDPFVRECWLRLHQHGERSSMLGVDDDNEITPDPSR